MSEPFGRVRRDARRPLIDATVNLDFEPEAKYTMVTASPLGQVGEEALGPLERR
jgi:hypothetical protein